MFYHKIKEYKPVRFKGYDIFLELKANSMVVASCVHDDDKFSFVERFMNYTKKQIINKLKEQIKEREENTKFWKEMEI
tara:strand:+ start:299 stop:532 length:234 start_codon:yes stop_codon:yes gene_type:complete